jgi:hypothetical protein
MPAEMLEKLRAVQRHHRSVRLQTGLARTVAVLLAAMLLMMVLDWLVSPQPGLWRWIMTLSALSCGGVALILGCMIPLLRHRTLDSVARDVDASHPDLEERAQTVTEFSHSTDAPEIRGSPGMIRKVAAETALLSRNIVPSAAVSKDHLLVAAKFLAGAAAVLALFFVVDFQRAKVLTERFFQPSTDITLTQLEAKSGDVVIGKGENVTLDFATSGKPTDRATVSLQSATGRNEEVNLEKDPKESTSSASKFSYTAYSVSDSFDYTAHSGDGRTVTHHVTVLERPKLASVQFRLEAPAYSQLPLVNQATLPRQIKALEGSKLQVTFQPDQADVTMDLKFADGKLEHLQKRSDGRFEFDAALSNNLAFEPELVNSRHLENQARPDCEIIVYKDQPPTVTITSPSDQISARPDDKIQIEFEARDDFGLTHAELVVTVNNDNGSNSAPVTIPIPLDPKEVGSRLIRKDVQLDLSQFNLQQDQELSYSVRVTDTKNDTSFSTPSPDAGSTNSNDALAANKTPQNSGQQNQGQQNPNANPSSQNNGQNQTGSQGTNSQALAQNQAQQNNAMNPSQQSQNRQNQGQPNNASAQSQPNSAQNQPSANQQDLAANQPQPNGAQPSDSNSQNSSQQNSGQNQSQQNGGQNQSQQNGSQSQQNSGQNTAQNQSQQSQGGNPSQSQSQQGNNQPQQNQSALAQNQSQRPNTARINSGQNQQNGGSQQSAQNSSSQPQQQNSANQQNQNQQQNQPSGQDQNHIAMASPKSDNNSNPSDPNSSQPPPNNMTKRALDTPGQSSSAQPMRIKVDEFAKSFDGQMREKQELAIDPTLKLLDELLKRAHDLTETNIIAANSKEGLGLEQTWSLEESKDQIRQADRAVVELKKLSTGTPYAFIGLQISDIDDTHIVPAREELGEVTLESAKLKADKENLTQASFHIEQARTMLAALTKNYDTVKRDNKLADAMQELKKMHQIFLEDTQAMLGSKKPPINQINRKVAEVDDDYAAKLQKLLEEQKNIMEELAKILADDPRMLRRFMALQELDSTTLRDQMTLLARRQTDLTKQTAEWTVADESSQTNLARQYLEAQVPEQSEIASLSAKMQENMITWLPDGVQQDQEPVATALTLAAEASRLASLAAAQASPDTLTNSLDSARKALAQFRMLHDYLPDMTDDADAKNLGVFAANRLTEADDLVTKESGWVKKMEALRTNDFPQSVQVDQHRLALDTQTLNEKLDAALPGVAAISTEIHDKADQLLHTVNKQIIPEETRAVDALGRKTLKDAVARQEGADTAFAQAETQFDDLMKMIVDKMDATPPPTDPGQNQTLEDMLAMLKDEKKARESLGIPNRPLNVQVMRDWLQQSSGSPQQGGGQRGGAARQNQARNRAAQQQARDASRQADRASQQARRDAQLRAARLTGDVANTDSGNAGGPKPPSNAWNTLASKLGDELRQSRDNVPPEQYRQAIEQYFNSISQAVPASPSAPKTANP